MYMLRREKGPALGSGGIARSARDAHRHRHTHAHIHAYAHIDTHAHTWRCLGRGAEVLLTTTTYLLTYSLTYSLTYYYY